MGKSQKKRSMRRHNPMRVPDSHIPKGLGAASSSKQEAVLPIMQKMESPDASERKWACVAVSNLIQNDPSTRRLLQGNNVVGVLITRLSDSEEEVVIEAVGTLRNLCIDGGYDICGEMYNKNIIAPLRTFPAKISNVLSLYLSNPKAAPENARKVIYEWADNVITILWCLSETSNKALNSINQISLIPFLMSFLASRDKLPSAPVTSAAQCLYVLTEDNPPAVNNVRSDAAYVSCLFDITRSEAKASEANQDSEERAVILRLLTCGILRNISPLPPSSSLPADFDRETVIPLLLPVISSVSLLEHSNRDSEPQIQKLSLKNTPKSDHKSAEELELERIETKLRSIQLALEILTGACATLPDVDLAMEGEDDMDENEVMHDEPTPEAHPSPANTSFLSSLVEPLLSLIQPTPLSFPPHSGASPHPPTASALSAIHICAMECLNNIFLSLSASPNPAVASDTESGWKVWSVIFSALQSVGTQFGPGQERRKDIWEIGVGVLWGIGNTWKGNLIPQDGEVKLLMQMCDVTTSDTVRIRCVGALECLAQHPQSIELNRTISRYLLSMLPSENSPAPVGVEPMIQATSAIIDIYSDENMPYDVNFRRGGYVDRLAQSVEGFRRTVRGIDKRKEGGRELRMRGDEVRENLQAFVEYRRDLGF
ncbi:ARM repeat-containing protein [Neolentinus lepideus HHB14362 ss-1]|uniref:ARM repeat-containing protein n=1 Tax=Neolentinus lepideus HHB14362 ss-1 TaxID=1314782 RepID=A0A165WCB5_9AGAM|nr:ARM repeat-containing protein [Neolentinus lepideus HHB14362 ss-1]